MGKMGFFDWIKDLISTDENESANATQMPHSSSDSNRNDESSEIDEDDLTLQRIKNISLKQFNDKAVDKYLKVEYESNDNQPVFYCPMHKAKIFCHSILIDKLGDLTKFIITSLHRGYSIDEINDLTQMGDTTIKEELEYLIRGELVEKDNYQLTVLGRQYGTLLEIFDELSDGIDVMFNGFLNVFELIDTSELFNTSDEKFTLQDLFKPVLARNDNFSNSLKIAQNMLLEDIPFQYEIRNSLYTTVKISKKPLYKKLYLDDFVNETYKKKNCITVAVPCEKVSYRLRFRVLDSYRDTLSAVRYIYEKHPDLISEKAELLVQKAMEENDCDVLVKTIDTIEEEFIYQEDALTDLSGSKSYFTLDRRPAQLILEGSLSEVLYLEEVERSPLYLIRYYSFE